MSSLLLEQNNIIPGNIPVDLNDGELTSDICSLSDYGRALVVLSFGVGTAGSDLTVTLQQCTDKTNSLADNKALDCLKTGRIFTKMAANETALRALTAWTEETQATADEVYTDATSGEQCGIWAFEIRAEDLDRENGFDCIYAVIADPGAAKLGSLSIILGDPAFAAGVTNMKDPLH